MPPVLPLVLTIGFGVMASNVDDFPERFALGAGALLCAEAAIKTMW